MLYTFDDAKAKDRHLTQYFEIFGNRAVYNDGWLAGTVHRAPWEYTPRHPLTEDVWELYDTRKDFSLVFVAMHAVTGPYAQRILVQVWDGGGLRRGGVCVCVCAK